MSYGHIEEREINSAGEKKTEMKCHYSDIRSEH